MTGGITSGQECENFQGEDVCSDSIVIKLTAFKHQSADLCVHWEFPQVHLTFSCNSYPRAVVKEVFTELKKIIFYLEHLSFPFLSFPLSSLLFSSLLFSSLLFSFISFFNSNWVETYFWLM